MCQRKPIYASVIAAVAAALVGGPTAMAAGPSGSQLPYTASVTGSWSGSLSDIISQSSASANGWASGNAPTITVPWGKIFTPSGTFTISVPALPSGDTYNGTWQVSPQSFSSAGAYGSHFCNAVPINVTIPASGGSWSVPFSQLWGTMGSNWDQPANGTEYNCQVHVNPAMALNASGGIANQQDTPMIYGLPVRVVKPPPSPSPTPSPIQSARPTSSPTPTSSKIPPSSAPVTVSSATSTPTPTSTATATPATAKTTPSVSVTVTPKASRDPMHSQSRGVTIKATEHPARMGPWWILLLLVVAALVGVILVRRSKTEK